MAALEESEAATRDILSLNRRQKSLGDTWEESQGDPGGDSVLQKRKIHLCQLPWRSLVFYPGHSVSKREGKSLQETNGRSLGWILVATVSSKREISSRVAALVSL